MSNEQPSTCMLILSLFLIKYFISILILMKGLKVKITYFIGYTYFNIAGNYFESLKLKNREDSY